MHVYVSIDFANTIRAKLSPLAKASPFRSSGVQIGSLALGCHRVGDV